MHILFFSVCVYGGACRKSQVDICSKGVDIVIATPGRFNDLVCDQVISLKSITYLVSKTLFFMHFFRYMKKLYLKFTYF